LTTVRRGGTETRELRVAPVASVTTSKTPVVGPHVAPRKPDCDPPYRLDAQGHRVYIRECLK
jgi:hypothetical protein